MNRRKCKVIEMMIAIVIVMSILCSSVLCTNAAGSYNLNQNDTSYRLYSEYHKKTTAGLDRKQVVSVYLKAGEAAYFGSSVSNSKIDINENVKTSVTGVDISVTSPNGEVKGYDVNSTSGAGYINTREKESSGPAYYLDGSDYSKQTQLNSKGYTPLSFVAEVAGVYQFRFHSVSATEVSNTGKTLVNAAINQSSGHVGMWDVTVVDKDNSESVIRTGRAYTNYLALSAGANNIQSNPEFYVATDDGYIYDVKLNDVDPWGFVVFANNRGLVTTDLDSSPIYHSVATQDNDLTGLVENNNVTFHSPNSVDTDLSKIYKIFFEEPNKDVQGIFYNKALQTTQASDIKFYGYEENSAYFKHGGYFQFNILNASSCTLRADFSDNIPKDADYDGSGIIEISDAVVDGLNTFYWDGKDIDGNYVPVGEYILDEAKITVTPKSGEIHFPLFDIEAMGNMVIKRINDVYDSNGIKVIDSASTAGENDIYYNNNPLVKGTINGDGSAVVSPTDNKYFQLTDLTDTFAKYYGGFTGEKTSTLVKDAVTGEYKHVADDSSLGNSLSFKYLAGNLYSGGNQAAVDTWTYYHNPAFVTSAKISEVKINPEPTNGSTTVRGRVFYDADKDGLYRATMTSNDYTLRNISLTLKLTDTTTGNEYYTTTDENGVYHFFDIPYGNYTLSTSLDEFQSKTYICSSNNENQQLSISEDSAGENFTVDAGDIGYYVNDTKEKNLIVKKEWGAEATQLSSVLIEIWAEYTDDNNVTHEVNTGRYKELSSGTNWAATTKDLPAQYTTDSGSSYDVNYFIKEYYYQHDSKIFVGQSDPNAVYDNSVSYKSTDTNNDSEYVASFSYSNYDVSDNMITVTNNNKNAYMVIFHENTHINDTNIFRIFVPKTENDDSNRYFLTDNKQINYFYDIPDTTDRIFKGWYYDKDNSNDSNPVKWDSDVYETTTHIYAHWIDVGVVNKSYADKKLTYSNKYKGFDLFGVQIRMALSDPNYPGGTDDYPGGGDTDVNETGLRFVTTIKESILSDLSKLFPSKNAYNNYTSGDLDYGYVTAKTKTADKYSNSDDYKLEYKGTNVNGVDTTQTYKYITNVECTSSVGNYTTNGTSILDHRNFSEYRIFSMVFTYSNPDGTTNEAAKSINLVARPYVRYTDANGLLRTFYNDYVGTSVYGGCSTNYDAVYSKIKDLEDVE